MKMKTSHESRKPPVPKKSSLPQANTKLTHRAAPPIPTNPLAQEKAKISSNLTKLDGILNQLEKQPNDKKNQGFIKNYKEYSKNISTYLMENPNNTIENFQQTNRDLENTINSVSGMLQAPKTGFVHSSSFQLLEMKKQSNNLNNSVEEIIYLLRFLILRYRISVT